MFGWRLRKSAGRRVTAAVYRAIRRGDAARDAGRWSEAAAAYAAALAADPALHHIHVQLGHALKEAGSIDRADLAYAAAARLLPNDPEPVRHRAHLARRHGRFRAATRLFLAAAARDGGDPAAAEEDLRLALQPVGAVPPEVLRAALGDRDRVADADAGYASLLLLDEGLEDETAPPAPLGGTRPLLLDVTDLVGHFRHARLPTGIQRVQIEVIAAAFRDGDAGLVRLCAFIGGHGDCVSVPSALFREMTASAARGSDTDDPAWQHLRARLFLHLALAGSMVVPDDAVLVNLGTSLWVADYFLFIRNARARHGLSYMPMVHDLVPLIAPQFCVPGLVEDFSAWAAGLFHHADALFTYAASTATELVALALRMGQAYPRERIELVTLDADFRPAGDPASPERLARWGLAMDEPFVLIVSTIEPRKNHVLAFEAWAELVRRHGASAVPRLVCVGRDGWKNDDVFDRLAALPELIPLVTFVHRVSDAELSLLYGASLFTLYPSLQEGWGLPVTESLCHGKVPVVADNSSLRQAGAGLAEMFRSGSVAALVEVLDRAAFDADWRAAREARIATEFRPQSWADVAVGIVAAAARFGRDETGRPATPEARVGRYYRLGRHLTPDLWPGLVAGEVFRIGDSWLPLANDGCRIGPDGAELIMRVDRSDAPLRLHVRLKGLATRDCTATIGIGGESGHVMVSAGGATWLSCDLPADGREPVSIVLRGTVAELSPVSVGGSDSVRPASVTVVGFIVTASRPDEAAAALAAIEGWREQP